MNSKVARPSGPENDHVISHTPGTNVRCPMCNVAGQSGKDVYPAPHTLYLSGGRLQGNAQCAETSLLKISDEILDVIERRNAACGNSSVLSCPRAICAAPVPALCEGCGRNSTRPSGWRVRVKKRLPRSRPTISSSSAILPPRSNDTCRSMLAGCGFLDVPMMAVSSSHGHLTMESPHGVCVLLIVGDEIAPMTHTSSGCLALTVSRSAEDTMVANAAPFEDDFTINGVQRKRGTTVGAGE